MKIKYLILSILFSFMLILSSCDEVNLERFDKSIIEIIYQDNNNIDFVTKDIELVTNYNINKLTDFVWESSNTSVISNEGLVTRQYETVVVTLKASFKYDGVSDFVEFRVKVIGLKEFQVTILGLDQPLVLYADDNKMLTLPNLEREGYTYYLKHLDNSIFDISLPINGPITLNIIYEEIEELFNITYVLYPDLEIPTDHINFVPINKKFSSENSFLIENPSDRLSAIFIGWLYNGSIILETPNIKEDITLIAVWEIRTHQITLEVDGLIEDIEIFVNHSDQIVLETPIKEGYIFIGWFYEEDGIEQMFTPNMIVNKDYHLVAVWQKN